MHNIRGEHEIFLQFKDQLNSKYRIHYVRVFSLYSGAPQFSRRVVLLKTLWHSVYFAITAPAPVNCLPLSSFT